MPAIKGVVDFKYGLQSAYTGLAAKDVNTLYFTTDTQRLFVGETEYTRPVGHGTSLPGDFMPPDSLFVVENGTARSLYYSKDGESWDLISRLPASITAGVVGANTAGQLDFGASIKIPKVTYDDRGNVTSAEDVTVKLPAKPADIKNTVTVTGEGNAVTGASFDTAGHALTLTKGETFATKKELTDAVGAITSFEIDSNGGNGYADLDALKKAHATGTAGVFYLVVNPDATDSNAFVEYFWTGKAYEMAGKFGEVDHSSLATKQELTDGLAKKVDKTITVNGQALDKNVTIIDITGNAGTATKLQTARKINGVNFDGSKDITIDVGPNTLAGQTDVTITDAAAGQSLVYDAASKKWINKKLAKSDINLGNVDNTADANKVVKSAGTLTTARTITLAGDATGSVSFNGSKDVTINVTGVKAAADGEGNNIVTTYATKEEAAAAVLTWQSI